MEVRAVKMSKADYLRKRDFMIMVEGPTDVSEIMEHIRVRFPDAKLITPSSMKDFMFEFERVELQKNFIEARPNSNADPARISDPREGSAYFRFEVAVWPCVHRSKNSQVGLGRQLIKSLRSAGWQAVGCASFTGLSDGDA
jgi:hypothetical protein